MAKSIVCLTGSEIHGGRKAGHDHSKNEEPCFLDYGDCPFDDTDIDGEERPPWEAYYGVRLSQRSPDHFWRYYDLFVRYWPRKMFHRKFGYESGFFAAKKRLTGGILPLYEDLAIELTERHLENDTWFDWKERQQVLYTQPDRIWLGLHMPKYSRTDLIDIDAKKYLLGYYREDYMGYPPPGYQLSLGIWSPTVGGKYLFPTSTRQPLLATPSRC